jgi:hypothetical protein
LADARIHHLEIGKDVRREESCSASRRWLIKLGKLLLLWGICNYAIKCARN